MNLIIRTQKLLNRYDRMNQSVRMKLLDRYTSKLVWQVFADTRWNFYLLIPKIPYIGEHNIWQSKLDTSAMVLALLRTLKKHNFSKQEAFQMTYDIFEACLLSLPKLSQRVYRKYHFSTLHLNTLHQGAIASQQKRYPADWVFTLIDGDNKSFDIGVDISDCAILKFYREQGVEECAPCLCMMDFAQSQIFGLGFNRSGTLADGAPVCDYRWKY